MSEITGKAEMSNYEIGKDGKPYHIGEKTVGKECYIRNG